jgi:hypothetical protein
MIEEQTKGYAPPDPKPPIRRIEVESRAISLRALRPLHLAEFVTRNQVKPSSLLFHISFTRATRRIHKIYVIIREKSEREGEGHTSDNGR